MRNRRKNKIKRTVLTVEDSEIKKEESVETNKFKLEVQDGTLGASTNLGGK